MKRITESLVIENGSFALFENQITFNVSAFCIYIAISVSVGVGLGLVSVAH